MTMLEQVLKGLTATPKTLCPKYLYDSRGSELFEKICALEEYYPTRTEVSILEAHVADIALRLGERPILYEFGSGSSRKTRILLRNIDRIVGYVPIDICQQALQAATERLQHEFPALPILPLRADFTQRIELNDEISRTHQDSERVAFFPGSTIGNFTPEDAARFLAHASATLGPTGKLLIGVDLKKDPVVLERAYNDALGVTRDFNLNILHHLNRELGANFDVSLFRHRAFYNGELGRIEMHLVCDQDCYVTLQGQVISLRAGESIHTENSYKYETPCFVALAERSGFRFLRRWSDPQDYFSVFLFEVP